MLRMQLIRERNLETSFGATAEMSGPLHDNLVTLASQCGIESFPKFYLTDNSPHNTYYISGSRFPYQIRPGKILISRELFNLVSRDTLSVFIAHELDHREKDAGGVRNLLLTIFFEERPIIFKQEEINADMFAAQCMGKTKVIAAFEEITNLVLSEKLVATGGSKKMINKFSERIRALQLSKQP